VHSIGRHTREFSPGGIVGLCIAKQAWAACLSFQLGEMHWGEEWLDSIKRAKATKAKIRNLIAEDQLRWRRQSAYAMPDDYIFVSKTMREEQPFGPTTHESASAVQGRASRGSELRIDSPVISTESYLWFNSDYGRPPVEEAGWGVTGFERHDRGAASYRKRPCGDFRKFWYCTSGDGAIWSGRGTTAHRFYPRSVSQD
jgi:hypothetical protein